MPHHGHVLSAAPTHQGRAARWRLAAAIAAWLALAIAMGGQAQARPTQVARAAASSPQPAASAASAPRLVEDGHYRNIDGAVVHSPAHTDTGTAPAGAVAQCRDASYSFSAHRRGTCSHHGGVARWL
jgi:uncharacterized membrane protein YdfJ with MMPL/SSD domain